MGKKGKGKYKGERTEWKSKTVGTGQRVANPNYREQDQLVTNSATGEQYKKKHVGYGEAEYLKERWTKSRANLIDANYYDAGPNDPGITPTHQRGAYGFAHMDAQHITTGRKWQTLSDPDQPLYEYEKTDSVREEGRPSSSYQRADDEMGTADSVSASANGSRQQTAGGRSRSAWDEEPVDAEIVDEDDRTSKWRRGSDTIDAEGWDVDNGPGLGRARSSAGLPFRRNAGAVGPGSTMQAAGQIGMGERLALPVGDRPAAEAERTEEGALPMSAGEQADMVPGFNTGRPTSGSRRGAKRPRSGMNPNFSLEGSMQEAQGNSVFEARTRAYRNILQPPPSPGFK